MNLRDKTYLAKGKRGIAYTAYNGKQKVLIKEVNPASAVNTIAHEADMLKVANTKGVGPLFLAIDKGALIREFVEGEEIVDWIKKAKKPVIKKVLLDIVTQCRKLDELGMSKQEMTHPHKHILVRKNLPVFIDFDRARYTEKPKNLTQICQWITSTELQKLLAAKDIVLDRYGVLTHAKAYKQHYRESSYNHIIEMISHA